MKFAFAVVIATLAAFAVAAPLNINLGAYSPALVVGDGAIGFEGAEAEGEAATEAAAVQANAIQGNGIASE
ncbi:Uu.00g079720.m01.CDS01 [Anthostomella pinea]|uniref:Uu.00g079720.m01.CDS01 n=1 Tax=Anthostomella pinea TaxID=933095 RepID=A0AAI8VKV3_9PEZI|nr:Uu.00g079720.m01.CDS01 [Anthostomella pinea]